jgi:hypothetical protein
MKGEKAVSLRAMLQRNDAALGQGGDGRVI